MISTLFFCATPVAATATWSTPKISGQNGKRACSARHSQFPALLNSCCEGYGLVPGFHRFQFPDIRPENSPCRSRAPGSGRQYVGFEMFAAPARAAASTAFESSALVRYHLPTSVPRAANPISTIRVRAKITMIAPFWLLMMFFMAILLVAQKTARLPIIAPSPVHSVCDEVRKRCDGRKLIKRFYNSDAINVGGLVRLVENQVIIQFSREPQVRRPALMPLDTTRLPMQT